MANEIIVSRGTLRENNIERKKKMKDAQGTNIINPETIKIIRNLRAKGVMEKRDREYYVNFMTECLKMKYGDTKSLMSLIEDHAQEWCIEHGIIGYDYIANVNVSPKGKSK